MVLPRARAPVAHTQYPNVSHRCRRRRRRRRLSRRCRYRRRLVARARARVREHDSGNSYLVGARRARL